MVSSLFSEWAAVRTSHFRSWIFQLFIFDLLSNLQYLLASFAICLAGYNVLCSPNLFRGPPSRHFPKLPSNTSTHFVPSNLQLVQPSDVTTLTTPGWVGGKNQHRCSLLDAHVRWLLVHPTYTAHQPPQQTKHIKFQSKRTLFLSTNPPRSVCSLEVKFHAQVRTVTSYKKFSFSRRWKFRMWYSGVWCCAVW